MVSTCTCGFVRSSFCLAIGCLTASTQNTKSRLLRTTASSCVLKNTLNLDSAHQSRRAATRFARSPQQNLTASPAYCEENGAGEGNRTPVFSLEGCCSTIELHPHPTHDPRPSWWRGLDSNQRRHSQRIYSPSPLATRAPLRDPAMESNEIAPPSPAGQRCALS